MHSQKEIPPLSEIVRYDNLNKVLDLTPYLNLSEILIIGAKPLHSKPRPDHEIKEFNIVAKEKLRDLEKKRDIILEYILSKFYQTGKRFDICIANNDLNKYFFLLQPQITPQELNKKINNKNIIRDMRDYRIAIQQYCRNSFSQQKKKIGSKTIRTLQNMQQTPQKITYFSRSRYAGKEPHLIVSKTKVPNRVALKIPYCMIRKCRLKDYRSRAKTTKSNLSLEDGIIKDIVGLRFVNLTKDALINLKQFITANPDIEVLGLDDYYAEREGEYQAIHMDLGWNPKQKSPQLLNPHRDTIETHLLEYPHYINANFGLISHKGRASAQKEGIVHKYKSKYGWLKVDKFEVGEYDWMVMVGDRILKILTYNIKKKK